MNSWVFEAVKNESPVIVFGTPNNPGKTSSKGIVTPVGAGTPTKINWNTLNGFQNVVQPSLDINNFDIPGAEGFGTMYSDFDDWNNLIYDYRTFGGGTTFDGIKPLPQGDESTGGPGSTRSGVLLGLNFFDPRTPTPDGTQSVSPSGKKSIEFFLFDCDPAFDSTCTDPQPLPGELIQLKMMKISGDETTGELFIPPVAKKSDKDGFFTSTDDGRYTIKLDLDKLQRQFSSIDATEGNYGLYYLIFDVVVPDEPDIPLGLLFDDGNIFELCSDIVAPAGPDDDCSATVEASIDDFNLQYTARLGLFSPSGGEEPPSPPSDVEIEALIDEVNVIFVDGGLKKGDANKLRAPLLAAIDAVNAGVPADACPSLAEFDAVNDSLNSSQKKKISDPDHDSLAASSSAIQGTRGC